MDENRRTMTQRVIKLLTYQSVLVLFLLPLFFLGLNRLMPHHYVDEKFHIPQTIKFCEGKFNEWDPKITTLPGLYLFSWLVLSPLKWCTTFNLRLVNLSLTFLNFYITYKLIKELQKHRRRRNRPEYIPFDYLTAYNITLFPPLFFWFFLYYTDIFSMTMVLLMLLFYAKQRNFLAAIFGASAILIRQTNVVWVGLIAMESGLNTIEKTLKDINSTDSWNLFPYIRKFFRILRSQAKLGIGNLIKFLFNFFLPILPYSVVILAFLIFVYRNEGIVVGDKTAHTPVVHLTQVLYCVVFISGFAWPYVVPHLKEFGNFVKSNLLLTTFFFGSIVAIIHYNTLVHPYLIADNRHFTFYLWKNIINRNTYSKYLLAPIYLFGIYAFLKCIKNLRLLSKLIYIICICTVLIPQLLLEPRYFIVPYILFRLTQVEPQPWQLAAETITTNVINVLQFFIFYHKAFYWEDEVHPQRIGW